MSQELENSLTALHECFCKYTGQSPKFAIHERAWADFVAKDFKLADLEIVLWFLKRQNNQMQGAKFSLRLDKLLDFEYRHFDAILSEARAVHRNFKPATAKQTIMEAWRPTVGAPLGNGNTRHISELIRTPTN